MCPTHSETKQTRTLEFEAEKGLLQDQAKRMSGLCPKIWAGGCRLCDFLLICWWWGNRAIFQESCVQSEVTVPHVEEGLRALLLSCRRAQRYCYVHPLRGNQNPSLHCCLLTASTFSLHPLPSLNRNCFKAQLVKHLPSMLETWVQFLGREVPLEKEMTTHSSILAWRIPWTEEPCRL